MKRIVAALLLTASVVGARVAPGEGVALSGGADALKFAVLGDNGTGEKIQYDLGQQMSLAYQRFPYEFVIMLGDNMYGSQESGDFVTKFERPYAALLQARIPFYAALGNHDKPSNKLYPGFNMAGQRYYTFVRKNVRFVVLDTNLLDQPQVRWAEDVLSRAQEPWKICYFHHAIYSDAGRHGSDVELRVVLEPILVRTGVNVVFAAHDHVYERLHPQKGITYFVEGAGGRLRKGDLSPSPMMAAGYDQDLSFMIVEVAGDSMSFQTISRTGAIVDSGVVIKRPTT
jgi:hypothetical protein